VLHAATLVKDAKEKGTDAQERRDNRVLQRAGEGKATDETGELTKKPNRVLLFL